MTPRPGHAPAQRPPPRWATGGRDTTCTRNPGVSLPPAHHQQPRPPAPTTQQHTHPGPPGRPDASRLNINHSHRPEDTTPMLSFTIIAALIIAAAGSLACLARLYRQGRDYELGLYRAAAQQAGHNREQSEAQTQAHMARTHPRLSRVLRYR